MSGAKVVPIGDASGFVGVVLRNDGDEMEMVSFGATYAEVALAALLLQQNVMAQGDD